MKTLSLAFLVLLVSSLVACSQIAPIPRDELAANLAPILKIEKRSDQIKYYTEMLLYLGGLSQDKAEDLKAHYDVYYVYYLAANVSLARGSMESYLANVKLAEKEIDLMEAIVRDRLAQLGESNSGLKKYFSQSGL